MAWVALIIAGIFGMVWATGLNYSEGFSKLWPGVITIAAMVVSFWLLASRIKSIRRSDTIARLTRRPPCPDVRRAAPDRTTPTILRTSR